MFEIEIIEIREKEAEEFIWIANMIKKINKAVNEEYTFKEASRLLFSLITETDFKFKITNESYGFEATFSDEIEICGMYGYFIPYEFTALKEYCEFLSESYFNFEIAAQKYYSAHYEIDEF